MPENLYKRGSTWWGRIQLDGKDLRRSLRTTDRATARARLKRWREELDHVRFTGDIRPSWQDACVRWAKEFLPGNVKPRVADRYLASIAKFDALFGDLYIDQITIKSIAKFVSQEKARKTITNATIRRDLTAASSVLRCCVAWQWRDDNPAKQFDRSIIRERRDPIRLPSDMEVLTVIMDAPQMLGRLLLTLLQTGAREEEIGSIEHPQIQPGFSDVLLTETKSNRPRMVPLTPAAAGTLSGTPRNVSTRYVFWHQPVPGKMKKGANADDVPRATRYVSLASNLAKIIDCALNPAYHRRLKPSEKRPPRVPTFRPHDLRHKFAVDYLRENPESIYRLQKILGHSSVKTTEIYLDYLSQDPAQEQRFAAEWPFDKPLRELSYDELLRLNVQKTKLVL
jgi:integrase/recombinase XerD